MKSAVNKKAVCACWFKNGVGFVCKPCWRTATKGASRGIRQVNGWVPGGAR